MRPTDEQIHQLRTEAIIELDTYKFREFCKLMNVPDPSSDEVILAGLHKARLFLNDFSAADKQESRMWLNENGYSDSVFGLRPM